MSALKKRKASLYPHLL